MPLPRRHYFRILLYLVVCLFPAVLFAQPKNSALSTASDSNITVLEPVTVNSTPVDHLTVSSGMDAEMLEQLPGHNGNSTDFLELLPGVQVSEEFGRSKTDGEIKPAELSISGGRTHENNYILDGIGTSSLLDPNFKDEDNIDNIPGHAQQFFIPAQLIKSEKVLRANIPARYGGFTGGVVEQETLDPKLIFNGELSYKMTDSAWTEFHIAPDDKANFKSSVDSENQSDYRKYQAYSRVDLPLNPDSALLLSYTRNESIIPTSLFDGTENQRRRTDTLFLKYLLIPDTHNQFRLSLTYNPYHGDLFIKDTLHSDYRDSKNSYNLTANWSHQTDVGIFDLDLSWVLSENHRKAPQIFYSWLATASRDRGKEGGNGDFEKEEESFAAALHFESTQLTTGIFQHTLNAGIQMEQVRGRLARPKELTRYTGAEDISKNPDADCNGNTADCVDGDQFFWFKSVYPEDHTSARIGSAHTYLEDEILIKRLTLRPGLRVSYNDLQDNTDLAPRFAVSYDLFGDQQTLLIGGYNKYFGSNLLAYELENRKKPFQNWLRGEKSAKVTHLDDNNNPKPWEIDERSTISAKRASDLKTPYSIERNLGLNQQLWGGKLELLYLEREYLDQFITILFSKDDSGYKYQELQNAGRRHYREFSLGWKRSWQKHYLEINATWQNTESNSSSYLDSFAEDETNGLVWYEGAVRHRSELPINDFNRPLTASLIYSVQLPKGFSFTNTTRYRRHYQTIAIDRSASKEVDGLVLDVYRKTRRPTTVIFDWAFSWESPSWREAHLKINLEIDNVFNRRIESGTLDDEYLLGRQFWAGLDFYF